MNLTVNVNFDNFYNIQYERKSMEITIAAGGGHGDVRPCVALALELQKIGHTVRFATSIEHQEFISSFRINYVPMEWNAPERSYFLDYPPFLTIDFHGLKSVISQILNEKKDKILKCMRHSLMCS